MSRSASARLAVCGTFLLFCSTCQAQYWYSTAAPPAQPPASAKMAVPQVSPQAMVPQQYQLPRTTYATLPTTAPQQYQVPRSTHAIPPAAGVPPRASQMRLPQARNYQRIANAQPGAGGQQLPPPQNASAAPQSSNEFPSSGFNQGLVTDYDAHKAEAAKESSNGKPPCGPGCPGGLGCVKCSGHYSKGTGFFFRYDRLYLSVSAPDGSDIGSPAVAGTFISNGIPYPFQNSLDSGFINDNFEFAGDRIEFGFLDGGGNDNPGHCGSGWIASILSLDQDHAATQSGVMILFEDPIGMLLGFQDGNGDGIHDDIDGDMIYGGHGLDIGTPDGMGGFNPPPDGIPDTPAPQDIDDLVSWQPIFGEVTVSSRTDVSGLALSRFHTPRQYSGCDDGGTCVRFLWGARYLDIDERFSLVGTGSFFDQTRIQNNTHNFIIGPEIGVFLGRARGPWSFGGELRFVPGVNIFSADQTGVVGSNAAQFASQNAGNRPLNLSPVAFTNRDDGESFSAVAEWRAEVAYACTSWLSLRVGYTGIFVGEIARGSDINYSLPAFGMSNDRSDIYINALTLGAELVY